MKKKIVIIAGISILVVIIVISIILVILNNVKEEEVTPTAIENTIIEEKEEPLVVGLDREENVVEEEKVEVPQKTPAELTQEIYNINGPIGTLVIPKTGVNTQIYSNVTVDKMEEMPCFLYTTGGLNQVGNTLFVGHNRENGTLFSDNNKLEEGDEFYFTDLNGTELKYVVYSKFTTTDSDMSFVQTQTEKPVIALSCCLTASDTNMRTIIMGRAE